MIFVTVGSQKFPFDRLLRKLDALAEAGVITEELFAQTGCSTYVPRHYASRPFLDRAEFADLIDRCSMVITHGGTGVIIGAAKRGKKVIAVPRLAKFGEHVDDHQLQLLDQFREMQLIEACYEVDSLEEHYAKARETQYQAYESNTHRIIEDIEHYITGLVL